MHACMYSYVSMYAPICACMQIRCQISFRTNNQKKSSVVRTDYLECSTNHNSLLNFTFHLGRARSPLI